MTTNQTIDGVTREFVREGRYIVVKPDYEDDIRTERLRNYIEEMCFHTPDCVVVEADWPEYEPVWRMIEARVIGNPTELDTAKATISKLQGLVAELRALLDAPAECRCKRYGKSNPHWPCPVHTESAQEQALDEMRALLDAPVHPCPVQLDGCDGSCTPAAKPQGEPVAWMQPGQGGMCISNDVKLHSLKMGGRTSFCRVRLFGPALRRATRAGSGGAA